MSKMRDPFDTDTDETLPSGPTIDLSGFTPRNVDLPRIDAIRDVETISKTNGFLSSRSGTRRRRGPIRHPWTIRAPLELRREIEAVGEQLDIRDDDVIKMLLENYKGSKTG